MPHARQQIRAAVAQLLTGLTTTGNRVFVSHVYPLEKAALPGLIIMTDKDEVDSEQTTFSGGQLKLLCRLQLMVKAYAKAIANVDDKLDQIELEVREILMVNRTLGGLAKDINWQSTVVQLEAGSEQPIGVAEISFIIDYRIHDNLLNISIC